MVRDFAWALPALVLFRILWARQMRKRSVQSRIARAQRCFRDSGVFRLAVRPPPVVRACLYGVQKLGGGWDPANLEVRASRLARPRQLLQKTCPVGGIAPSSSTFKRSKFVKKISEGASALFHLVKSLKIVAPPARRYSRI
jgi:hypothetical protein